MKEEYGDIQPYMLEPQTEAQNSTGLRKINTQTDTSQHVVKTAKSEILRDINLRKTP